MSEWTSPYNPFNSMKMLVHAENFMHAIDGKPKPPIVINMDLTNRCNYACRFCMFGGRERTDKAGEHFRSGNAELPKGYVLGLPKLWKDWGAKAVCLAGGGEPSLHPDCLEFIANCGKEGLDLGFVTNGYMVNSDEWARVINQSCKFVGFSIDAGNRNDYSRVKLVSPERFEVVLENMNRIRNHGKVQIGYKFVLDQFNYEGIYEAAKKAKENGATHFQFRPAIDSYSWSPEQRENIWGQIDKAQKELEDKDFRVMGVRHKFNEDLTKKHNFDKCRATYLTSTWCADGNVYMCTDTRGCEWSKLTTHYPDPANVLRYWGSEEHQKKVDAINFRQNCDRCTLAPANEMFERVFINDDMDKNLI